MLCVCIYIFIVHQLRQLLLLVLRYSPVTTTIIIIIIMSLYSVPTTIDMWRCFTIRYNIIILYTCAAAVLISRVTPIMARRNDGQSLWLPVTRHIFWHTTTTTTCSACPDLHRRQVRGRYASVGFLHFKRYNNIYCSRRVCIYTDDICVYTYRVIIFVRLTHKRALET